MSPEQEGNDAMTTLYQNGAYEAVEFSASGADRARLRATAAAPLEFGTRSGRLEPVAARPPGRPSGEAEALAQPDERCARLQHRARNAGGVRGAPLIAGQEQRDRDERRLAQVQRRIGDHAAEVRAVQAPRAGVVVQRQQCVGTGVSRQMTFYGAVL